MRRGAVPTLLLLALAGCADESREGDERGPESPPGQIITVPGDGGKAPARKAQSTAPSPPSEPATKSAFIAEADAICAAARPEIKALEESASRAARSGDFESAAGRFEEALERTDAEIAGLRDLAPPAGSEALLDRMYAGIEEAGRIYRAALDDLRSGDVTAFNAAGDEARLATGRSRRIAASFGFEVCGRGG